MGTTAIVKATVEKSVNHAIKTLSGRISSLKSEVDGGYGKVSALEERISDLQGAMKSEIGRQNQLIENQNLMLEKILKNQEGGRQ